MKQPGLRFHSPRQFTVRQRVILAAAPRLAWLVLRSQCITCRVDVIDKRYFDAVQKEHGTVIAGFWHETLAVALNIYRNTGYHTLTSQSFDGELAARCCDAFGLQASRGSSSRGGVEALRDLVRASKSVSGVGFTLDGPKGPRREAKPGVAILAAKTGVPIVPNAILARPCWRMRSWDRMAIPKPFGALVCAYAEPIPPPDDLSREAIETTRLKVEASLNELHERLESESEKGA